MARRIVIAVLALVAAVLGVVAVPLGLVTASQDRHDFRDETVASTTTLANVAEERLDDHKAGPGLDRTVRLLATGGGLVGVFDPSGTKVAGTAVSPPVTRAQIAQVAATGRTLTLYPADDRLLVISPVQRDSGRGRPARWRWPGRRRPSSSASPCSGL